MNVEVVRGRFGGGSGMVGQGRESICFFFGRPDGFGSSDFAQIVDLFMLYRSILVSGSDSKQILSFGPRKGRNLRTGVA